MNQLLFDAETHKYTLDGVQLPSVTQIIKAILPPVFEGATEWHMQRGTATHYACELLDHGVLDWSSVDPEIEPRVRAWQKFRREYPATIKANEMRMASTRYQFAGTVDRILDSEADDTVVCDLKNSVAPQVFLQLAFYSLLFAENAKEKPHAAVAVELQDDGSYRTHWLNNRELRRAEQQALALLTTYNFAQQHNLLRDQ